MYVSVKAGVTGGPGGCCGIRRAVTHAGGRGRRAAGCGDRGQPPQPRRDGKGQRLCCRGLRSRAQAAAAGGSRHCPVPVPSQLCGSPRAGPGPPGRRGWLCASRGCVAPLWQRVSGRAWVPRSGRTRLEEAPGTDPISLTGPGLRGQALPLPGGQSRLCGWGDRGAESRAERGWQRRGAFSLCACLSRYWYQQSELLSLTVTEKILPTSVKCFCPRHQNAFVTRQKWTILRMGFYPSSWETSSNMGNRQLIGAFLLCWQDLRFHCCSSVSPSLLINKMLIYRRKRTFKSGQNGWSRLEGLLKVNSKVVCVYPGCFWNARSCLLVWPHTSRITAGAKYKQLLFVPLLHSCINMSKLGNAVIWWLGHPCLAAPPQAHRPPPVFSYALTWLFC